MQVFRISSLFCSVALFCTVFAANILSPGTSSGSRVPSSQGQCDSFVKQCFKTCFALGKIKVAYSCTYNAGIYGAFCGCSGVDQTNVALAKAGIPASTVTTTLQTTRVATTLVTDTSIASTQTTATATIQTSVCSYTTIASTILVTTTLTADAITVTSLTTATITTATTTTAAPVFTSSVPAAVVSLGSNAQSKRDLVARGFSFCSEIQLACTVGCALQWSTPGIQICQASARSGQYSIACICKNKVNVVQKVIQNYNLFKPFKSQCTQITTTSILATSTVTATSVSVTVITNRVTVVPTTVVSVLTSTVAATMTYACPTTLLTTSIASDTVTPTTTELATISTTFTTTLVAAAPTLFYVSAAVANAASPSYFAQMRSSISGTPQLTGSTVDAQAFVILQVAASDSLYNLVGVGPGIYNGMSLGLESLYPGADPTTDREFYAAFEPIQSHSQGPPADYDGYSTRVETAIWQIDLQTLVAKVQWESSDYPYPRIVDLYGFVLDGELTGADSNPAAFKAQYYRDVIVDITKFTLVPV